VRCEGQPLAAPRHESLCGGAESKSKIADFLAIQERADGAHEVVEIELSRLGPALDYGRGRGHRHVFAMSEYALAGATPALQFV